MKTISTKYHGPTNHRGSRIRATDGDNSVTVSYDDALHHDDNHAAAALALARELNWHGVLIQGATKTGEVFVFERGPHHTI